MSEVPLYLIIASPVLLSSVSPSPPPQDPPVEFRSQGSGVTIWGLGMMDRRLRHPLEQYVHTYFRDQESTSRVQGYLAQKTLARSWRLKRVARCRG